MPYFREGRRGAELLLVAETVVDDLAFIADVLEAAAADSPSGSVGIVLGNSGDFGATPVIHDTVPATTRAEFTVAVVYLNGLIRELADERGYPVLDLFAWVNLAIGEEPLVVGGVELDGAGFVFFEPNPDHFFEDSQHPGSIAQGLLANMVIEAANRIYGLGIEPLSEQEIVTHAYETADEEAPSELAPGATFFDVSGLVHDAAPPEELLLRLADSVAAINIASGIANSLDAKLHASLNALFDAVERNDSATLGSLSAFVNSVEAQRGRKISPGHAHYLLTAAERIMARLP
ncbi:MAG: hypothetical protein KY475_13235 [Planctomycetes bacterium]|nr:hypothetical protein [Planctomycetota bacterium]